MNKLISFLTIIFILLTNCTNCFALTALTHFDTVVLQEKTNITEKDVFISVNNSAMNDAIKSPVQEAKTPQISFLRPSDIIKSASESFFQR